MRGELEPVVWSSALFDRTGYAEEARNHVLSLDHLGVPVVADARHWTPWQKLLRPRERERLERLVMVHRPARFVHVIHAPAAAFVRHPDASASVGRTMWETDGLPAAWVAPCNAMDEVWVPSAFNVETFARAGVRRDKLHVVPESLQLDLFDPSVEPLEIAHARGFVFLAVFAWHRRKGWDVLLRAYVEEFDREEDVTLVLKVHPGLKAIADSFAELRAFVERELGRRLPSCPRIVVLDTNPGAEGLVRLYRAADAYVLPVRGEGWGRPFMEAMAMGLPTIGTRWSGNLAFMNDANSYLIDSELVDVSEAAWREWPAFRGQRWAEPSVAHLRRLMRHVVDHPAEARARGARARDDIRARCGWENVAGIIARRLGSFDVPHGTRERSAPVARGGAEDVGSVSVAWTETPRAAVSAVLVADGDATMVELAAASVAPAAREVLVVDRGLPPPAAAALAARGALLVATDRVAGVAEAWQAAIARASGDWLLLLGPGETLDPESASDVARMRPDGPACYGVRVLGYAAPSRRLFTPQWEPRIVRRALALRSAGRVRARLDSGMAVIGVSGVVVRRDEWRLERRSLEAEAARLRPAVSVPAPDPFVALELGLLDSALGRPVEAEGHLLLALTRLAALPATPPIVAALGNAYLALSALTAEQQRWSDSATYAYAAAQLLTYVPEAFESLGRASASLRLHVVGLRAFERAMACEVEAGSASRQCTVRCLTAMAQIHIGLSEWPAAAAFLERAREVRPGDPGVLAGLSRVSWALGQAADAGRSLHEALRRWDVPPEAWLLLADVYRDRGRTSDAERALEAAMAEDPAADVYRIALERVRR